MAITGTHAKLFQQLPLPRGGPLLEIGEANWYGDIDPESMGLKRQASFFDVAKEFYQKTFEPERVVSIDWNGSPAALRIDLNAPAFLDEQFDVVINHGTAEHVFNIGQVFRTMHDACAVGGLMVHDAPFTGWIDHGFYLLQPTLFYDLARANCYEITLAAVHEAQSGYTQRLSGRDHAHKLTVPNNSMLFVALRKIIDAPFRIPIQGYYAGALSQDGERAWREKR